MKVYRCRYNKLLAFQNGLKWFNIWLCVYVEGLVSFIACCFLCYYFMDQMDIFFLYSNIICIGFFLQYSTQVLTSEHVSIDFSVYSFCARIIWREYFQSKRKQNSKLILFATNEIESKYKFRNGSLTIEKHDRSYHRLYLLNSHNVMPNDDSREMSLKYWNCSSTKQIKRSLVARHIMSKVKKKSKVDRKIWTESSVGRYLLSQPNQRCHNPKHTSLLQFVHRIIWYIYVDIGYFMWNSEESFFHVRNTYICLVFFLNHFLYIYR